MESLPVVVTPEWAAAVSGVSLEHLQDALARPDLWQEVELLEKLLYKNSNQHRGSLHFQRLQEVRRLARLLRSMQLDRRAAALSAALAAAKQRGTLPTGSVLLTSGGDQRRLPTHEAAAAVLRALLAACGLVEELAPAVHRASLQLLAQLAHSFFMPLCLTALAALARIQVLAGQLLLDAVRAYNVVAEVAVLMPPSSAAGPAAAAHSSGGAAAAGASGANGGELPQMLRAQWRGGLPQVDRVPCAQGEGLAAQAVAACSRYALHFMDAHALPATAVVMEEGAAPVQPPAQRRARGAQRAQQAAPVLAVVEDRGVSISREAFAAAGAAGAAAAAAARSGGEAAQAAAAAEEGEQAPVAAEPVLLGVVEDCVVERRARGGSVEVSSLMEGETRGHLYRRTAVLSLGEQPSRRRQQQPAPPPPPPQQQELSARRQRQAAVAAALPGAAPGPVAAAAAGPKPAFVAVGAPAAAQQQTKPAFLSVGARPAQPAFVAVAAAPKPAEQAATALLGAAAAVPVDAASMQPAAPLALGGGAARKRKKPAAAAAAAAAAPKSWEDWLAPAAGIAAGSSAQAGGALTGAQAGQQGGKRRKGR